MLNIGRTRLARPHGNPTTKTQKPTKRRMVAQAPKVDIQNEESDPQSDSENSDCEDIWAKKRRAPFPGYLARLNLKNMSIIKTVPAFQDKKSEA